MARKKKGSKKRSGKSGRHGDRAKVHIEKGFSVGHLAGVLWHNLHKGDTIRNRK